MKQSRTRPDPTHSEWRCIPSSMMSSPGTREDVLRLCTLILRDRHEAEDVLQESILRLVRLAREGETA